MYTDTVYVKLHPPHTHSTTKQHQVGRNMPTQIQVVITAAMKTLQGTHQMHLLRSVRPLNQSDAHNGPSAEPAERGKQKGACDAARAGGGRRG